MKSSLNWFEIPVVELDRAARFYEGILQTSLQRQRVGETEFAILRAEAPGVSGALVLDAKRKPAQQGTLIYLNADGQLDGVIGRVKAAGGEVLLGKTDIGAPGFIALIRDTEGNQVGLHAERA